jgi:hypothetical protein
VLFAPLAQAQATTQTFNPTGAEQMFTVPAGVTSINVLAIGEEGRPGVSLAGGLAAEVRGERSVTPGQTLYVEVADLTFNGGGEPKGDGGGGASDVRTSPRAAGLSPDTRLIVAGGGGGTGEESGAGAGGNAGEAGKNGESGQAEGGGAGTLTSGGAGGHGFQCTPTVSGNGTAGQLGSGGNGGACTLNTFGGGGGGGYYGGGGGGDGPEVVGIGGGGGGGGGSSLVPAGGSMTLAARLAKPVVQLSYNIPLTVTKVEPNHGAPQGGTAVTITGTGFTGATAVKFGSTNATSFTVNSETSITAVSPTGKGTVDVTVTTPAGTSPTSAADQFTFSKK